MRRLATPLAVAALAMLLPQLAAAKDVYIDADSGSDVNTCVSENSPCATFAGAESVVAPGDDIFTAGAFSGGIVLSNNFRGTSSDQMRIAAWSGKNEPTIDFSSEDQFGLSIEGDYVTVDGFTIGTSEIGTVFVTTASNGILQNSSLHGGLFTVSVGGSNNQVIDNTIVSGLIGVNVIGSDQTVSRNLIYCEAGTKCNYGVNIQNAESSIFTNNIVHSFNTALNESLMAIGVGITEASSQILVLHNTFYNNRVAMAISTSADELTAVNNIVHLGSADTNYVYSYSSGGNFPAGMQVDYNDYYSTGSGGVAYVDTGTTIYDSLTDWRAASGKDANSFAKDPEFTDPAAVSPDFTLQAGSPAIDAGNTHPAVTDDFNGNARPAGDEVDLGAYEYGSESGSSEVDPPTDITVSPIQAHKATVQWTAPDLVSYYELTYATNKAMTKNRKTVSNITGDSKQLKKLRSNQKYHAQIRTVYEADGETLYSDYSDRFTFLTKAETPKKVLIPNGAATIEQLDNGNFLVTLQFKLKPKKKNSRKKLKAIVQLVANGKKIKFEKAGADGLKKSHSFKVKGKKNIQTKEFVIPAKHEDKQLNWKVRLQRVKTNKSKFKASKKFMPIEQL